MPKKSKKEKIIAELRRRSRIEHSINVSATPLPVQSSSATFQFRIPAAQKQKTKIPETDTSELIAIKKDLTKTAILSMIAIGGELALYFLGRR